jgi:DNA-binding response OmpR family regulator
LENLVLAGRSILLVEDEPLIRMDVGQRLQAAGATVFVASQLEQTLRLAEHPGLSAGVLDFELVGSDTTPVCWRLIDRRVPFIFHTGTAYAEFRQWPQAPVLIKPKTHRLIATVAALFR